MGLDEVPENISPENPRQKRKFLLQDLLNLEAELRGVWGGSEGEGGRRDMKNAQNYII